MSSTTYKTKFGDMWDMISFRIYGDETFMSSLIEANPQYREIVVFPANVEIIVPELKNAVKKSKRKGLPPWRG